MIRPFPLFRIAMLCLLAIGLLPANANSEQPHLRSTLRVGLWTLWHDSNVKLISSEPGHSIRLRTCAGCAAIAVTQPASIRAAGDALVLTGAGRTLRASRVLIAAPVTLAAHGETLILVWPLTVTASSGVLVLAVTMPVESYVNRVVASESRKRQRRFITGAGHCGAHVRAAPGERAHRLRPLRLHALPACALESRPCATGDGMRRGACHCG
jgi:hypothetical protein